MKDKYYIYAHINQTKNEIFYIGKGFGNRASSKKGRNEWWKKIVLKYGYTVCFLEENLNEEQAFLAEIDYIKIIGRRDKRKGTLVNFTDGGEGTSGHNKTDEVKRRISELRIGFKHSEDSKRKMSEVKMNNTYNLGKKVSDEVKNKMSESQKGNKNNLGKQHSEETKNKISKAISGNKNNLGKTHSNESKLKISQAFKGKPWSEARRLAQINKKINK